MRYLQFVTLSSQNPRRLLDFPRISIGFAIRLELRSRPHRFEFKTVVNVCDMLVK